jgi:hypothetical protein
MLKKIAVPLFLLIISIMVYCMATSTIERTLFSQQKIMRIDSDHSLKRSLSYLSTEDIKNLKLKYKIELTQLDHLKSITIILISLSGILLLAIIAFKPNFSVNKFDGITLMVYYILLVCTIFTVFKIFTDGQFEDGHSATSSIRISTESILVIITPLIFYASLKMNKFEISKNMHKEKWITNLALFLTLLSGFITIVIGIAILSTPDVSKFTS